MKIVFDNIIFGTQLMGGISVSWYELLSRSIRDGLDVSFVECEDNGNLMRRKLGKLHNVIRIMPQRWRKAFKYLPVICHQSEPYIFHSSYYRFSPSRMAVNVVIVHDFTNELFQKGLGARKERFIKHNAIRHADYIVCNSNYTRSDFFKFFPNYPKERVSVIYTGAAEQFSSTVPDTWDFKFSKKKYALFVGERAGYKNFSLALEAMKHSDLDFVAVGKPFTEEEMAEVTSLGNRFHYLGRISNEQLNILYYNAFALIYPSSYEGFGLPVIEAQRACCPVIAMKASSVAEVIGDTPLAFEKYDYKEILSRLEMLEDDSFREKVIALGLANEKRFSWEKMYQDFVALYKKAYDERCRK